LTWRVVVFWGAVLAAFFGALLAAFKAACIASRAHGASSAGDSSVASGTVQ
jgi:hypothetical protein